MSEKTLEPARHEHSDVGEWFIWIGAAGLIASVVFLGFVVYFLFPHALRDWDLNLPLPEYPAPRQQADPRADMQNFLAGEMQRLNSAGWVNKAEGIVHTDPGRNAHHRAREDSWLAGATRSSSRRASRDFSSAAIEGASS